MAIPNSVRVPDIYIENVVQETASEGVYNTIVPVAVGNGAVAGDTTVLRSSEQASTLYGRWSVAHLVARAHFGLPGAGSLSVFQVAEAAGASGTIFTVDLDGAATASGTITVRAGDVANEIEIANGSTGEEAAAAVVAGLSRVDIPYTVTASADTLTLTTKAVGTVANQMNLSVETNVAGIETDSPSTTPATGAADYSGFAIGGATYNAYIAVEEGAVASIRAVLANNWNPTMGRYGFQVAAVKGTVTEITTALGLRNNSTEVLACVEAQTPSMECQIAAATASAISRSYRADPVLGVGTESVAFSGPPVATQYSNFPVKNTLIGLGGLVFTYNADGTPVIQAAPTTRTTNDSGTPIENFRDVSTILKLMTMNRRIRNTLSTTFRLGKANLRATPGDVTPGSSQYSPEQVRAQLVAMLYTFRDEGYIDSTDLEIQQTEVTRSTVLGRLNANLPTNLTAPLAVVAITNEFKS